MNYEIENFLLFIHTNSFPIIIVLIYMLAIIHLCSKQKTISANSESLELDLLLESIENKMIEIESETQLKSAWEKYLIENGFNEKGKLDIVKTAHAAPKEMLQLAEQFLKLNPDNYYVISKRAILYDKTFNYEAAKIDCEKFLQYDSTDMDIIRIYVRIIAILEGENNALETLNKLYIKGTNDAEYYSLCAEIYKGIKNLDTAYDYITKSIELAPNEASYYLQRSVIYPLNRDTPHEIIKKSMEDTMISFRLSKNDI